MKVKTAELTGNALDWAVSLITNPDWTDEDRHDNTDQYRDSGDEDDGPYSPSTNWAQAGPIIEQERLYIQPPADARGWCSYVWTAEGQCFMNVQLGSSALEAAMRCFVASKLGDEVDVPQAAQ